MKEQLKTTEKRDQTFLQRRHENMSAPAVSRLDLILGMVTLALGRLFPTLKSPPVDLTGKIAIVTGANSGIGLQIALDLAKQGCTVYLACRNISKAQEAVSQIMSQVPESKPRVKSLLLDTSSLDSVCAFANDWETLNTTIDLLFHNAGAGFAPAAQPFSADGFPLLYATNMLGSFLLTYLLEPRLAPAARVIMTSSTGQYASAFTSDFSLSSVEKTHEPGFHVPVAKFKSPHAVPDGPAYNQTKGMQAVFAKLLQGHFDRKAAEAGVPSRRIAHAFTPGFTRSEFLGKAVDSGFFADPQMWVLKMCNAVLPTDVSQGAATGVWLACTDDEGVVGKGMGGGYWDRMTRRLSKVDMMSKDALERFWVRWEADAGLEWR